MSCIYIYVCVCIFSCIYSFIYVFMHLHMCTYAFNFNVDFVVFDVRDFQQTQHSLSAWLELPLPTPCGEMSKVSSTAAGLKATGVAGAPEDPRLLVST